MGIIEAFIGLLAFLGVVTAPIAGLISVGVPVAVTACGMKMRQDEEIRLLEEEIKKEEALLNKKGPT